MLTRLNPCYTSAQEAELTHPCRENLDIREEILDLITSMSLSAREAELRPRIAKHLSGRVRPSGRIHVIFLVKMSIYLAKSENNAYLGTIFTA